MAECCSNNSNTRSKSIGVILLSIRPWSFTMTITTLVAGSVYASYEGYPINILALLLVIIGVVLLHGMANWLNDYFDHMYGVDRPGTGTTVYRPHPLIERILDPRTLLISSILLGFVASSIGTYIAIVIDRPLVIPLGLLGAVIGFLYTGPPLNLKYRAFGEPAVFLAFGPLMFIGSYYVQTGFISLKSIIASIPFGLLITAVLLANNIRDIEGDRAAGIRTLAVVLGRRRASLLYISLLVSAYVITFAMIVLGLLPLVSMITMLTVFQALKLCRDIRAENTPLDMDPRTARLVLSYSILFIISLAISIII
ncbi:MAG: 1,4-dihydroxy-2-naphthoate octaprenyltransferase [Sulfolobales archaeon]